MVRDSQAVTSDAASAAALTNFIYKFAKHSSACVCACLFIAYRTFNTASNTATNRYDNPIYTWNSFNWKRKYSTFFQIFEWITKLHLNGRQLISIRTTWMHFLLPKEHTCCRLSRLFISFFPYILFLNEMMANLMVILTWSQLHAF